MPSESHHVFRPLLAYPAQGCCTVAPYNLDVLSLTAGTCTAPQASVRGSTQEGQQMHFCCRPPMLPRAAWPAACPAPGAQCCCSQHEKGTLWSLQLCALHHGVHCLPCILRPMLQQPASNQPTQHLCGSLRPCLLPHTVTCSAVLPHAGALSRTEWLQGFAVFPLAAGRLH